MTTKSEIDKMIKKHQPEDGWNFYGRMSDVGNPAVGRKIAESSCALQELVNHLLDSGVSQEDFAWTVYGSRHAKAPNYGEELRRYISSEF